MSAPFGGVTATAWGPAKRAWPWTTSTRVAPERLVDELELALDDRALAVHEVGHGELVGPIS